MVVLRVSDEATVLVVNLSLKTSAIKYLLHAVCPLMLLYFICILLYFVCVFSQDLHGTCEEGVVPGHISGNYGSPSKYTAQNSFSSLTLIQIHSESKVPNKVRPNM